jgi:hypothetical protein
MCRLCRQKLVIGCKYRQSVRAHVTLCKNGTAIGYSRKIPSETVAVPLKAAIAIDIFRVLCPPLTIIVGMGLRPALLTVVLVGSIIRITA